MANLNNDELLRILTDIKENSEKTEGERHWSSEDIDRLLELTARGEKKSGSAEIDSEPAPERQEIKADVQTAVLERTVEISEVQSAYDVDERLKAVMNDEEPTRKNGMDASGVIGGVKNKLFSAFGVIKTKVAALTELSKNEKAEDEERFILSEEEDDFEPDGFETVQEGEPDETTEENDDEMKIVDESPTQKINDKTDTKIYIEKPGIVIKKGESEEGSDLQGAPIIMSADDALESPENPEEKHGKTDSMDIKEQLREAIDNGQIVFSGFEALTDEPEQIDEEEAEQKLFEDRKEKIRKFTLFGSEENDDPYGADDSREKLGELFGTEEERPRVKEPEEFIGVEYSQIKDARRVQRYLVSQKKKSFNKITALGALLFAAFVVGIFSSAETTVAGDKILTILFSLVIIVLALVVGSQSIAGSFEAIKKKKFGINEAISISAIVCFLQNVLMLVLYFLDKNTVSVFSAAGVSLLFVGELSNYLTFCRTKDAMELCTGDNRNNLYSIESITDDKDAVELGRNVKNTSPRIRYSCKTRFPSHLIELCTSITEQDKKIKIFLPVIALMCVINLVVAWAVNRHFAVGFAALTATLSLAVPFYGSMLIQLALRRTNKKLNKSGGMISCQDAVNELYRTNVVVLDSKDLFDRDACVMHGFKDFKNVRVNDAMLYAAAMVIRSGGPLTGVFDQMVVNRRDILPTVKSFSYEEKLGVSGWIYGQKVILGNRSLMINHNIDVPESVDEDKYMMMGHEVIYLAIAHKLAAMIVVDYAPDKRLAPYLKKLRDSGVSILVRNCDPNVTEHMISACYDMRLDNIKIISTNAGRVFKKYKSRPKLSTKAVSVHDGTMYTFAKTLCTAANLHHAFKIIDMLSFVGMAVGFVVILVLSVLNVVADLPAIFIVMMQLLLTAAFTGAAALSSGK